MTGRIELDLADVFASAFPRFQRWTERLVPSGEPTAVRVRLLNALHCDGPRRMGDLAGALGVTPRRVTALVDALEADDLVRRTPDAGDRRVTWINITDEGKAVAERTYEAHRESVAALFDELPPDEQRHLLSAMRQLLDRLERDEGARSPD